MLLIHTFVTWALTGLIWHVQVVQYPLFREVGEEAFARYHFGHCLRMTLFIVPVICLEAGTAAWLFWQGERHPLFLLSLIGIALVWISTLLMQAPLHLALLRQGRSVERLRRLVLTNWLRTIAWTARGGLLGWMYLKASNP